MRHGLRPSRCITLFGVPLFELAVGLVLMIGVPCPRASAEPAPVPAPTSTSTSTPASTAGSVERFLLSWRDAWSKQELAPYLAMYAEDCVADGRMRSEFTAHKQRLFARGLPLDIRLGDLGVGEAEIAGETLVRATFDQEYTSSLLADFGRKELILRASGDGFLIVRESWSASSGVIQSPLGATASSSASAAPSAGVDEPLLGSGYAPPADAGTAPAVAGAGTDRGLAMDPLLGTPFDVVEPDYGLPTDTGDRRIIEEIVATINGQVLTRTMLVQRIRWYEATLLEERPSDLDAQLARLAAQTLDATIDRWLILQEARSRQADIEGFWREWLAQFRRQMEAKDLDEVDALLKEQGSSLEELHQQVLETEVPNVYLQQAVGADLTFTDEEIEARFEANRASYERPRAVTLRQILIPVSPGEDPAKARAVADAVVSALREGKDWCELHEIYASGGPRCGDIGEIAIDDMLAELREVAVGVPVGAVSLPVLSSQGWHILRVLERAGTEPVQLADVRDRVMGDLRAAQYDVLMNKYLEDLRTAAEISMNPRYATDRGWANLPPAAQVDG